MKSMLVLMIALVLGMGLALATLPAQAAGPKEIKAMVVQASEFLAKKGDAGLAEISGGGKWKSNQYVFVVDFKGALLAHPIRPDMVGRSITMIKDLRGKTWVLTMATQVKDAGKGWSEYWFPKPGEMKPSRKTAYCVRVPGKEWIACSATFDFTKKQAIDQAGE